MVRFTPPARGQNGLPTRKARDSLVSWAYGLHHLPELPLCDVPCQPGY
jgi:hypothetical protein